MLNTYIKNRGITQTIVHNNNKNHFNQIDWDADYDGNIANILVNYNTDGKRNQFNVSLDNEDLANILNIQSVNIPIDRRLKMDFQEPQYEEPYFIKLPTREVEPRKIKTEYELLDDKGTPSVHEIIDRHISSPSQNEELIIPLTINRKTIDEYTLTPKKKHRRHKSHITHKIYKKHKSNSKSKSKTKTKTKKSTSSRRKTFPVVNSL